MGLMRTGIVAALVLLVAVGTGSSARAVQHVRNGLIVFSSYRSDDGNAYIYTITPAGKLARRLTGAGDFDDTGPAWSRDGHLIAFTRTSPSVTGTESIYVMTAAGRNLRRVTDASANAGGPVWSADGKRLAFLDDSGAGIAVLDLGKGTVTHLGVAAATLAWSPNGRRIAFVRDKTIYTVRPDGTGLTQITRIRADYGSVSWAPDSTRLVADVPGPTIGRSVPDLVVVKLNGSRRTLRAPANASGANWSPDGKKIVFGANPLPREGGDDIYVMNANGGGVRRVTDETTGADWPDWQPLR
jgi:Tol biopolymer transport system component